jgi:succinate-acetate transporter protein
MPVNIWTEEGEVRTDVPVEKIREAEMWRDATMASPLPLGLAALGTATFLYGVGMAFGVPAIAWVPALFVIGGITLWTMALFALRKGSAFTATFFGIVGSFNVTWALYNTYAAVFVPAGVGITLAPVLALLLFLTAFILIYLWFCSFQRSAALALVLLTLPVSYVLVGIGILTAGVILKVGGWFAIASAIIAYYTSFAIVWNSVAHREQVPMGTRLREEVHAHA